MRSVAAELLNFYARRRLINGTVEIKYQQRFKAVDI